jgi:hypothetical protein
MNNNNVTTNFGVGSMTHRGEYDRYGDKNNNLDDFDYNNNTAEKEHKKNHGSNS